MALEDHIAPGQALGYFFQLERAMSWLALSPSDSVVGVETEDDVVVKLASGEQIMEQDKSSTTSFPFVPSRPDLWKSLLIWLNAVRDEEIDIDHTTFYLVTNKIAQNDSLVVKIGQSRTPEECGACLQTLKQTIIGLNGEVRQLADKILQFEDDLLKTLLLRTHFSGGNNLCDGNSRRQLISDLQIVDGAEEVVASILNTCMGWLFHQVVDAWRSKKPALIERNAFIRVKNAQLSFLRDRMINQKIFELGEVPREVVLSEHRNLYVEQLRLINCSDEILQQAICDFLNASRKKTEIAKDGYITEKQIDQMDDDLIKRWEAIFERNKILLTGREPESIGRLIQIDTLDHNAKIGEYELRGYFFTRGSYHALADIRKVGWHPEFKDLLNR